MNSGKPRTFLQKIGDVFVSIAAVLFKIFLVALVILCCPVLFVLAVVLVALVFAAIAWQLAEEHCFTRCCLPSTGCRLLPYLQ